MISVVMPLYNKQATVSRALRSALAQTFQDFEIVVVDDGSTDSSPQIVTGIGDARVRLVHQTNAGVSAARNRGIAEARGGIVAFLDADDEWLPEFLETICELSAAHPASAVFATSHFNQCGDAARRAALLRNTGLAGNGVLADYFAVALASEPPIIPSALAARKAALDAIGGFPVGIRSGEDLLTWARLAVRFPIAYSTRPLCVYHEDVVATATAAPTRRPDDGDPVGRGLRELWGAARGAQRASLRRYTGLWHKMRAKMFLLLGERGEAFAEIARSLACHPWQPKLFPYPVLALLPLRLARAVFVRR